MGMADYLSRHPSPLKGDTQFAEELWNNWFTVNMLNSQSVSVAGWQREKGRPPMRAQQSANSSVSTNRMTQDACKNAHTAKPPLQSLRAIIASIKSSPSKYTLTQSNSNNETSNCSSENFLFPSSPKIMAEPPTGSLDNPTINTPECY